jgi:hypothetical protein
MPDVEGFARSARMRTAVAVGAAVTLVLGVFLAVGARVARPVSAADAVARFEAHPDYHGLGRWKRPIAATAVRPLPGVYVYATTGFSRIDRLGVRRRYPHLTTRIIRLGPGCQWQEQVVVFAEHTETYSSCSRNGDQADAGFGTRLVYFFVPSVSHLVCDDGGSRTAHSLKLHASLHYDCLDDAHHSDATVTETYLGPGSVTVEGQKLPCRRVEFVTVLRGSSHGGAKRTVCVDDATGIVLREVRSVALRTSSGFIGTLDYTEEASFTLHALRPLT